MILLYVNKKWIFWFISTDYKLILHVMKNLNQLFADSLKFSSADSSSWKPLQTQVRSYDKEMLHSFLFFAWSIVRRELRL